MLVLTAGEMGTLKTMADAYSFDYEEGFIEMCLEMVLFADQLVGRPGGGEVRFTAMVFRVPISPAGTKPCL